MINLINQTVNIIVKPASIRVYRADCSAAIEAGPKSLFLFVDLVPLDLIEVKLGFQDVSDSNGTVCPKLRTAHLLIGKVLDLSLKSILQPLRP